MPIDPGSTEVDETFDPDVDRHPRLADVFSRILDRLEDPDAPVGKLLVETLASGEATYVVYAPRAEEGEGGYLPPE